MSKDDYVPYVTVFKNFRKNALTNLVPYEVAFVKFCQKNKLRLFVNTDDGTPVLLPRGKVKAQKYQIAPFSSTHHSIDCMLGHKKTLLRFVKRLDDAGIKWHYSLLADFGEATILFEPKDLLAICDIYHIRKKSRSGNPDAFKKVNEQARRLDDSAREKGVSSC